MSSIDDRKRNAPPRVTYSVFSADLRGQRADIARQREMLASQRTQLRAQRSALHVDTGAVQLQVAHATQNVWGPPASSRTPEKKRGARGD